MNHFRGLLQSGADKTMNTINKVSLVYDSFCSNAGSIRDDPYWISRKNSLELIVKSSRNTHTLVNNCQVDIYYHRPRYEILWQLIIITVQNK